MEFGQSEIMGFAIGSWKNMTCLEGVFLNIKNIFTKNFELFSFFSKIFIMKNMKNAFRFEEEKKMGRKNKEK